MNIDQFAQNLIEKTEKIIAGHWTVNYDDFFVEIVVNASSDKYYSLISQKELSAIHKQFSIMKSLNVKLEDGVPKKFKQLYIDFNQLYDNIIQYQSVCNYFHLHGIHQFESISRKTISSFDKYIGPISKDFNSNFEPSLKIHLLFNNSQNSAFRNIGKIIQDGKNVYESLRPYIVIFLGFSIRKENFNEKLKDLLQRQMPEILFDSWKLGHQFYLYFSNTKKFRDECDEYHSENKNDEIIFKNIYNLKNEDSRTFPQKFKAAYNENSTLFLKVLHPSHCYHCIKSLSKILNVPISDKILLFCSKEEIFCNKIKLILEKDKNISKINFIIHPESLNEEAHSILVELINSRMNSTNQKKLSKLIIISSRDYSQFCFQNSRKFSEIEFKLGNDIIQYLCELSHHDSQDHFSYQLYYSQKQGAGKTFKIFEEALKKDPKLNKNTFKSFFIDARANSLPSLSKEIRCVHFDLSHELFNENYQIFDELWKMAVFGYFINPDGTISETPQNIIFEVPALTKDQFTGDGCIEKYDFPIYVDQFHVENPKYDIKVPKKVKSFIDKLFQNKVEKTSDLIQMASQMFFPNTKLIVENLLPTILNEVNIFMSNFCENLPEDEETSLPIFLLLLRTNFHVWSMESIYNSENMPKSFTIISNQNLFSKKTDPHKWIIFNFSSIDENNFWDISCLNGEIKDKIKNIQDSNILTNNFFKCLRNNSQIDIYSNVIIDSEQIYYEDNQAYLFDIIRKFFYFDDENIEYTRIIDNVIANHFYNTKLYNEIYSLLVKIKDGKSVYEKDKRAKHPWGLFFDTLEAIFKRYDSQPIDFIEDSYDIEPARKISEMALTVTFVKRFVSMLIRIDLNQPFLLEGETGDGKTSCIKILQMLIENALKKQDSNFNWSYHSINCLEVKTVEELTRIIDVEIHLDSQKDLDHIFFFDEINTSYLSSFVVNEMSNYNIRRSILNPDDKKSIVFIAAINPYSKIDTFTKSVSSFGLKPNDSELSQHNMFYFLNSNPIKESESLHLLYNVHKLYDSVKLITIKTEPELFFLNEDDKLSDNEYLPSEEVRTIRTIIWKYMNSLGRKLTKNNQFLKSENENLPYIIRDCLINYMEPITQIFSLSLERSFDEIRTLMKLRLILSYRDVKRCMQFFYHFVIKLINMAEDKIDINDTFILENVIPKSIILSITISIILRFSKKQKLENIEGKNLKRFDKLDPKNKEDCIEIDIQSYLLRKLVNLSWHDEIRKPSDAEDWMKIVKAYALIKNIKYISIEDDDEENYDNILKIDSLLINLFAISSCYSASKKEKDSAISCMIVGMPGTSKTSSVQYFYDYKYYNYIFYSNKYIATRFYDAEGLNSIYKDFVITKDETNPLPICSIDELGLINISNANQQLKFLHACLDNGGLMFSSRQSFLNFPIVSLMTSSYAVDYLTMNRSIFISADLPTDDDLARAFAFYCFEFWNTKKLYTSKKIREFKNKFLTENSVDFNVDKVDKYTKKFKNFFSELWKLTKNHERPDFLSIPNIINLMNIIYNSNKIDDITVYTFYELSIYLTSIICCHPSESFELIQNLLSNLEKTSDDEDNIKHLKNIFDERTENIYEIFKAVQSINNNNYKNNNKFKEFCQIIKKEESDDFNIIKKVIEQDNGYEYIQNILYYINDDEDEKESKRREEILNLLNKRKDIFKDLAKRINDEKFDDYNTLREIISSNQFEQRYDIIRTQNYECLEFIDLLIEKISITYKISKLSKNVKILKILPENFKAPFQKTFPNAINDIIDFVLSNSNSFCYILIIGNMPLADALLDTLYDTRLINLNGFSTIIFNLFKKTYFNFIINENDFKNCSSINSYPLPLLTRTKQVYLDYSRYDEFKIIDSFRAAKEEIAIYSRPYASFIHDYFSYFVHSLKDIKINTENEQENQYIVVFATSDMLKSTYFTRGVSHEIYELNSSKSKIEWDEKIIILTIPPQFTKFEKAIKNFEKFKMDAKSDFELIYYWSDEYDKLYNLNKKLNIPLPMPEMRNYLRFDGTIDKLIEKRIEDRKNANKPKKETKKEIKKETKKVNKKETPKIKSEELNRKKKRVEFKKKKEDDDKDNDKDDDDELYQESFSSQKKTPKKRPKGRKMMLKRSNSKPSVGKKKIDKSTDDLTNESSIENFNNSNNSIRSTSSFDEGTEDENIEDEDKDDEVVAIDDQKPLYTIILTLSSISEDIKFGSIITENNTDILFDSLIRNSEHFKYVIEQSKKDNLIIRSDHFHKEHNLLLRNLLELFEKKKNMIVIYHLTDNVVPDGLNSSEKWPVYWIDSITDSLLANHHMPEIADSILFKGEYNKNVEILFIDLLLQIYNDLISPFDEQIDQRKIVQIVTEVYKHARIHFHPMREVFRDIFYKILDKNRNNSYETVDIKRRFFQEILNQIPFLPTFIRLLILNYETINRKDIKETLKFIEKIFDQNIEDLIKKSEIQTRRYKQYKRNGLFFPELILPQVIPLFEAFLRGDNKHPPIDKSIIEIFIELQTDQTADNITNFYDTYLSNYVSYSQNYLADVSIYNNFKSLERPKELQIMIGDRSASEGEKVIDNSQPFRAIVLTLTPMMDEVVFDEATEIKESNTEVFYDSSIRTTDDLESMIINTDKENIVIRSNKFIAEHDRVLREILERSEAKKRLNLFIVYSLKLNTDPKGLESTDKWPVYWIESITSSFLPNRPSERKDKIFFLFFF